MLSEVLPPYKYAARDGPFSRECSNLLSQESWRRATHLNRPARYEYYHGRYVCDTWIYGVLAPQTHRVTTTQDEGREPVSWLLLPLFRHPARPGQPNFCVEGRDWILRNLEEEENSLRGVRGQGCRQRATHTLRKWDNPRLIFRPSLPIIYIFIFTLDLI